MSKANSVRRRALPYGLMMAALLAALALSGGFRGRILAQDAGTPDVATPQVECVPGTGGGAAQVATPEAASPEASPVAEPVGTPADDATAQRVVAASQNVVACYNAGNFAAFLDLVTNNFIVDDLGYANRDEAAQGLTAELASGDFATVDDLTVDAESVMVYDDGRFSVDVTYTQFTYQFVQARWFFVESGSDLLLDDEVFQSPDPPVDFVTVISASLAADEGATVGFDQSTSITQTEAVILHLINNSAETHEFAVIMLPEGTMATPVAEGEEGNPTLDMAAVESGMIVGYARVAGDGGIVDIAEVGLPAGLYSLVDFTDGTVVPLTINPAA
jgi:hypothetical protein